MDGRCEEVSQETQHEQKLGGGLQGCAGELGSSVSICSTGCLGCLSLDDLWWLERRTSYPLSNGR